MLNEDILRDPGKRIDLHVSIIFSVIFTLCFFRRFDISRPTTNRVEFLFLASWRFKPLQPFSKIHGKVKPLMYLSKLGSAAHLRVLTVSPWTLGSFYLRLLGFHGSTVKRVFDTHLKAFLFRWVMRPLPQVNSILTTNRVTRIGLGILLDSSYHHWSWILYWEWMSDVKTRIVADLKGVVRSY